MIKGHIFPIKSQFNKGISRIINLWEGAHGLQDLAAYVVFKLLKKRKISRRQFTWKPVNCKNNSWNEEKRFCWSKVNSLFHSFILCGGLYAVTPEYQALFCRAKKHFKIEKNVTSVHRINTEQITKSMMKEKDVISTYNSIAESCSKTEG